MLWKIVLQPYCTGEEGVKFGVDRGLRNLFSTGYYLIAKALITHTYMKKNPKKVAMLSIKMLTLYDVIEPSDVYLWAEVEVICGRDCHNYCC